MRTTIEIDDRLIRQAMRQSGATSKKVAVQAGLRLLVQTQAQGSIRQLRGRVVWEGNLHQSRRTRGKEDLQKRRSKASEGCPTHTHQKQTYEVKNKSRRGQPPHKNSQGGT